MQEIPDVAQGRRNNLYLKLSFATGSSLR